MRRALLAALLSSLAFAGCMGGPGESTGPNPAADTDTGQAGYDTTGCTGDHVGSGTGDIGADRACNATDSTPTDEIRAPTGPTY